MCADVQGEIQLAMRDAPPPKTCNVGGRVGHTGALVSLGLSCFSTGEERGARAGVGRKRQRRGRLKSPMKCVNHNACAFCRLHVCVSVRVRACACGLTVAGRPGCLCPVCSGSGQFALSESSSVSGLPAARKTPLTIKDCLS